MTELREKRQENTKYKEQRRGPESKRTKVRRPELRKPGLRRSESRKTRIQSAASDKQDWKLKAFKYGTVAAIVIYVIVLLVMTGGSSKPFKTISKGVESAIDTEALAKAKTQDLKRYYGLNAADYAGATLYVSKASMSAEEVLLLEVKSTEQIEQVQKAVGTRIENRRHDFGGYAPQEEELIDNSILLVRGNFIFFTISKNASQYKSAFTKSL